MTCPVYGSYRELHWSTNSPQPSDLGRAHEAMPQDEDRLDSLSPLYPLLKQQHEAAKDLGQNRWKRG